MDWIDLAQDRDMWWAFCDDGNEPTGFIKCGNFLASYRPVSFSRRTVLNGLSN